MFVSARHAMSMLYCFIDWYVTSRVWPVVDSSNPSTFWNRILVTSVAFFCRTSPKGLLFNFVDFFFDDVLIGEEDGLKEVEGGLISKLSLFLLSCYK